MRKKLYILFLLLLSVQLAIAQSGRYEYWIDNDLDGRSFGIVPSDSILSLDIDLSKMPIGLHYFNFRTQDEKKQWGGLSRYMFMVRDTVSAASFEIYEYWFDNDYEGRTIESGSSFASPLSVDMSKLAAGLHYFNFRAQGKSGSKGAVSRYLFLVKDTASAPSIGQYEYWLDNDYEHRTISSADSVLTSPLILDISQLKKGLHYFNYQVKGASGRWSGLSRQMFLVKEGLSDVSSLEYWLDDDRSKSQSIKVEADSVVITMDITDLEEGISHTFNVMGKSGSSNSGLYEQYEFTLQELPRVPTPVIKTQGNVVTISDGEGVDSTYAVSYYYTLDGTQPTRSSLPYVSPFSLTRNGVLKVIGVQYAHSSSEVAELKVDWMKVANPVFVQVGKTLTISSDSTMATIYYKIGSGEEIAYDGPIRLSDQTKVTAIGRYEGYNDSESVTYSPRAVKSAKPTVSYDGRYLKLQSNEGGVTFHYTVDGTSPADSLDVAESATTYNGRITIDSLCTLRAVAIIDSMNVSDVQVYPIKYLYDGNVAYVSENGVLSNAFEWCGGIKTVENLKVVGPLSNVDLDSLRSDPVLTHLDLGDASLTSRQIPSDAFAESKLVSFISPKDIRDAGGRMFADCSRLAAVVWNADAALQANTFEGVNNPNLLVYVNNESLKPTGITNVVVGGVAQEIKLADATAGNNNFYCPQSFTATSISYVHEYKQRTVIGVNRGWETLVLPFDVATISHEVNGALKPFYAEGEGMPFWLMELTPDSLDFAKKVVANIPYLVSMPNNPDVYSDIYNQAGNVTFSAHDVIVPVTELSDVKGAGVTLRPVLQTVARSEEVYALNVSSPDETHPEGSVFKQNYRDVRPFEAYILPSASSSSRIISISSLFGGDNGSTGIDDVIFRKDKNLGDTIRVYSISGALLKQGKRDDVIKTLPKGIYIINNRKVVIK
ncbi:MAG: chitobiase/beta-hexosaminidase C-terminal domain-containing protein [Prevotella sp.]|nr:chitobiase/beta-hexosaminidase C-terminal domain-containing protein [Prevotella sp.]MBR1556724.1 chitobiase/beta-hexosaminidase C-terminal domain-containing protein [Prevotella sp.]